MFGASLAARRHRGRCDPGGAGRRRAAAAGAPWRGRRLCRWRWRRWRTRTQRRATREHHTSRAKRRLLLHHHGLLLLLLLLRCRLRDGRRSVTLRLLRRIARLALLGLVTHPFILFSILFGDFSACVGRGLHHVVIYDGLASVHGWQRGTFVLLYAMRMQRGILCCCNRSVASGDCRSESRSDASMLILASGTACGSASPISTSACTVSSCCIESISTDAAC